MTTDLPYMPAVGNVAAILQKIRGAGTPPKFTAEFVKSTLGFTASQDRSFPRILKQLQFINADGTPLPRYNEFKAASSGGRAMADGLREGWAPIFLADQVAHSRSTGESTDIFKTVTGQGDAVAKKMAATFKTLASHADWSSTPADPDQPDESTKDTVIADPVVVSEDRATPPAAAALGNGINLHHDIHLHIPPTSDVAVYRAIFRALREELQ